MKFTKPYWIRWLDHLLVLGLCVMGSMIFINVVLRYVFNDGVAITEEVSRFIFVWLTFIGAVVAMKEGLHLGIEPLTRKLPKPLHALGQLLSYALMIFCCAVLFKGSWIQATLNTGNVAALSGIPVAVMYAAGVFASVLIGWILIQQLQQFFKGTVLRDRDIAESPVGEG